MVLYSSTPAWQIPWTEEPGRLQSVRSWRVRHDWATSLSLFTFMHWRRKWQPTPVFLPGECQGRGSLVGCRLWGHRVGHDWSDLAWLPNLIREYIWYCKDTCILWNSYFLFGFKKGIEANLIMFLLQFISAVKPQ